MRQLAGRSAEELVSRAITTPGLLEKIKRDPAKELEILKTEVLKTVSPLSSDRWIYRLVVLALALVALCSIFGAIFTAQGSPAVSFLTAVGSAAVGAMAGLLAPSPVK